MNPVLIIQGIARTIATSRPKNPGCYSDERLTPEEDEKLKIQIQAMGQKYGSAWGIFGPLLGIAVAFIALLTFLLH